MIPILYGLETNHEFESARPCLSCRLPQYGARYRCLNIIIDRNRPKLLVFSAICEKKPIPGPVHPASAAKKRVAGRRRRLAQVLGRGLVP
jgi:hypothetical protein